MSYPHQFDKIYSEAVYGFIAYATSLTSKILRDEMSLRVTQTRFFLNRYSYPFSIVIFEHPSKLGFFNPEFYEIGIHKKMLFCKDEKLLLNLLRHELAHFYCHIQYTDKIADHGSVFRKTCKKFGWDKDVFNANVVLTETDFSPSITSNKILGKVQKLLSLASSPHIKESEAATLKANQLLIKHNLRSGSLPEKEQMIARRLFKEKKGSVKISTIASILRCFFVSPIVSRSTEGTYLEIFGDPTNIEIAEFVGNFLYIKLDSLWEETRKKHPSMKGVAQKNSFFRGLASGYTEKMKSYQGQKEHKNALLVIEKKLQEHVEKAYPKLYSKKSSYQHCQKASLLGKEEGKNLNIKQGLKTKQKNLLFLG